MAFLVSMASKDNLYSLTRGQVGRKWQPRLRWDNAVKELFESALGRERFQLISDAIPTPPRRLCIRVNRLKTTREDVMRRLPLELENEYDRKMLLECPPVAHEKLPMIIMILGSGPNEVDYGGIKTGYPCDLDGKEVIVGRLAGESMLKGAQCYAPGILATTRGLKKGDKVAVSIGLETDYHKKTYGVSRFSLLDPYIPLDDERFPERKNLFLGIGEIQCDRSEMNCGSKGLVVTMTDRVFELPSLGNGIMKGEMMMQSLPSIVAAATLDPKPGSKVLDMCASPGGKTMAMAEMMDNKGIIYALDRTHNKVRKVKDLADELGVTIVCALKGDATKAFSGQTSKMAVRSASDQVDGQIMQQIVREERKNRVRISHGIDAKPEKSYVDILENGFEEKTFDYVLLDPPCSALGLRPRLMVNTSIQDLKKNASYQRMMIDAAVEVVRIGGFVVYSTCTINPLENEFNVRYLLDKFPYMKLVQSEYNFGLPGLTGSVQVRGKSYDLLHENEAPLVQRFDPGGELDTMGFFIAKFQRTY